MWNLKAVSTGKPLSHSSAPVNLETEALHGFSQLKRYVLTFGVSIRYLELKKKMIPVIQGKMDLVTMQIAPTRLKKKKKEIILSNQLMLQAKVIQKMRKAHLGI